MKHLCLFCLRGLKSIELKNESLIEALNEEENTQINSGAIKGYEFLKKITHSIKKAENLKGIQMRLPYDIEIN